MKHPVKRLRLGLATFFFALSVSTSPVTAQSIPLSSTNLSGTIASSGTFQQIQGQTNNRNGCTIQNTGSHTQYVFFGPIANATTPVAVELSPSQSVNCSVASNIVLKDAVSISGTSGDTFFANFQ